MKKIENSVCWVGDDLLASKFGKGLNFNNPLGFAWGYNTSRLHLCDLMIKNKRDSTGYYRKELKIWKRARVAARNGNLHPLTEKLQEEGRSFFSSEDAESEILGVAFINLAWSLRLFEYFGKIDREFNI